MFYSALQSHTSYEFLLITANVIILFPKSERKLSSLLHTAVFHKHITTLQKLEIGR
jgi:hypothetical protein